MYVIPNNSSDTKMIHCYANKPDSWGDLPYFLQSVIPSDEEYSYVIEECNELPAEGFSGAPSNRFTATMRINLNNGEEAKDWIGKMCNPSKRTYVSNYNIQAIFQTDTMAYLYALSASEEGSFHQAIGSQGIEQKETNPLMGELQEM